MSQYNDLINKFTPLQNARREKLLPYIHPELKGLEIGPSMHPTLDNSEFNICFLDYSTREEQYEHCASDDDYRRVPETDIIVSSDQYTSFVSGTYDYIVANHVIEHVSDVISWLCELEKMLVDNGMLFLTIPDKRFSFDKYRQDTSFTHLMCDYFQGGEYSDKEHMLDIYINYDSTYVGEKFDPISKMNKGMLREIFLKDPFIGLHRHVFSSETFLHKILKPILASGFVKMSIVEFSPTRAFGEFYVILKKDIEKTSLSNEEFIYNQQEPDTPVYRNIDARIARLLKLEELILPLHSRRRSFVKGAWKILRKLRS